MPTGNEMSYLTALTLDTENTAIAYTSTIFLFYVQKPQAPKMHDSSLTFYIFVKSQIFKTDILHYSAMKPSL